MSRSMLDENLSILIRESLDDTGNAQCVSASPDIIVRKTKFKEDDLAKIFLETYSQDISLESDDSGKMYLYVRFKNTSDEPLTNFYIHLYRNHLGLSNIPSDWSRYEMKTEAGTPAFIECLGAQKIGATPAFVYDKSSLGCYPNCFVAVATREKNPDYSSINDYTKYIQWVNKKNVAARNICVIPVRSGIHTQIVTADNPDTTRERRMLILVSIEENTPSGINYGIRQTAFGIEETRTYIKNDSATGSIACVFHMKSGGHSEFEIWFEAGRRDSSYVKYKTEFFILDEGDSDSILNQYLVDLHIGLAIPNGTENTSLISDCGHLLGCCYFRGSECR
ncbi:MAG: hypothetical protein K2O59_13895 [Lachnospiraceae bacterium]|nr:hypothetical protein [Lachnospiraceae bacterium]